MQQNKTITLPTHLAEFENSHDFWTISGIVTKIKNWQETTVSGGGGSGFVFGGYGHFSSNPVRSSTDHFVEVWVRQDNGEENWFLLQNHDVKVKAGHHVTMICASQTGKKKVALCHLFNHSLGTEEKTGVPRTDPTWLGWLSFILFIAVAIIFNAFLPEFMNQDSIKALQNQEAFGLSHFENRYALVHEGLYWLFCLLALYWPYRVYKSFKQEKRLKEHLDGIKLYIRHELWDDHTQHNETYRLAYWRHEGRIDSLEQGRRTRFNLALKNGGQSWIAMPARKAKKFDQGDEIIAILADDVKRNSGFSLIHVFNKTKDTALRLKGYPPHKENWLLRMSSAVLSFGWRAFVLGAILYGYIEIAQSYYLTCSRADSCSGEQMMVVAGSFAVLLGLYMILETLFIKLRDIYRTGRLKQTLKSFIQESTP